MDNKEILHNLRHSLAHILAAAVLEMFPKAQLGVGPVIENGFFYDFLLPRPLTPDDIKKLEKRMRSLVQEKLAFERTEMPFVEAKKFWQDRNQPFKVQLIEDIEKFGTTKADEILNQEKGAQADQLTSLSADKLGTVSFYKTGKFTDLCRGGHVENTSQIKSDAFKLDKVSGAYWRGDQKNPQMQRIYGLAFETKDELEKYLTLIEEAKKRDHKKLGVDLDLFTFSDLVGGGLPMFTPKGTVVREELENFVQALQVPLGYQRVRIPHITKKDLYETSGHWQKFKDELFKITTREGHLFAMKPMNCPHHTQIYASKKRSYRDLPIRYSEVTAVYRDEQSGELSGLSRVRMITQDDAHVFCRLSQVEAEALKVWDIVDKFYKPFKMPLTVRFSRHDPAKFEKYLGTTEVWAKAEAALLKVIQKRKVEYIDGPGEAAMYGPKIDFIAKDSLGREWQLATIQMDFNLPERFGLACINEKGEEERVAMIHRAILGSVERFMAILIEHYAGAFPLWLSPVQVKVLPISKKQNSYARKIQKELGIMNYELRIELDDRDESVGKKIREASMQKIPYLIIVGEKEAKSKKIAVRTREGKDLGAMPLKKFAEKIKAEIEKKK
jgi:threonyl-tRNA synthetase